MTSISNRVLAAMIAALFILFGMTCYLYGTKQTTNTYHGKGNYHSHYHKSQSYNDWYYKNGEPK